MDGKGSPVSGVLISVESGTAPYPDVAISSNDEGKFSVYLPSGRFRLGAYSQDGSYGTVELDSTVNPHLVIRLSKTEGN